MSWHTRFTDISYYNLQRGNNLELFFTPTLIFVFHFKTGSWTIAQITTRKCMDRVMCFELQTVIISGRKCCNVSLLDCIVQVWWTKLMKLKLNSASLSLSGICLTIKRHSSSYWQYLQSAHALLKLDNSSFIHFINYTGFQPETINCTGGVYSVVPQHISASLVWKRRQMVLKLGF